MKAMYVDFLFQQQQMLSLLDFATPFEVVSDNQYDVGLLGIPQISITRVSVMDMSTPLGRV
jgi:hypothetical protein